mgnify:CR=1 FL=1
MLTANMKVPAGGSIVVTFPFNRVGVRRLIVNIVEGHIELYHDTVQLFTSSAYQSLYEIKFESYYGFPDASKFKLANFTKVDTFVKVLIDTVPDSPINENYFEVYTI